MLAALFLTAACGEPPALEVAPLAPACGEIPGSVFKPGVVEMTRDNADANAHFARRMEEFSQEPLPCRQIVMLGDSHTELVDWDAAIPGKTELRNRGMSWDTSEGVLARMEEIVLSQPKAVFLLIGTNDVWTPAPPSVTVSNISSIVDLIRKRSPDTLIIVQTVFPMRDGEEPNDKIRAINTLLKFRNLDWEATLIDPHARLADANGRLVIAYTDDGLHLNAAGKAVWSELLTGALRERGLLDDGS
jgi:lysophospholipase L1-like esterase